MQGRAVASLYRDRVKDALMNAIRPCASAEIKHVVNKRMRLFNGAHMLVKMNRDLESQKCSNLNVILYSKYCMQRNVMVELEHE